MNPIFRVFQRAFVLTIIAVPSCARLLRAEDALSGKFQTPRAFIAGLSSRPRAGARALQVLEVDPNLDEILRIPHRANMAGRLVGRTSVASLLAVL
jgi:hypothetical protein